jgi:predicted MPP superfamily phosphohydrolase
MKKSSFVIFFSVVLSIYGLLNLYIFVRGWEVIPETTLSQTLYVVIFLSFALSFIVGRFLERAALSWISTALVWIGSFWLAAMVYFFLALVVIDVTRLAHFVVPFFPDSLTSRPERTGQFVAALIVIIVLFVVAAGYINARTPRVTTLHLAVHKNSRPMKPLNIVAVSDIHLGTIICRHRLETIVEKVNSLRPDLVLLPGDVVDEDLGPVIEQNLGETLRKIRAPLGVFAITGNHEYIGGADAACRYMVEHGITVLRDDSVKLNNGVYVVGREDRSIRQFSGKKRRSLEDLLNGIDKTCPIIVLDHQPFRLEEAASHGVDLQLSGHTHHGQLWPFNFITQKVYELSWGYKLKGSTHFYVSCGVGTWGPPVRTGNRAEIVNICLSFV